MNSGNDDNGICFKPISRNQLATRLDESYPRIYFTLLSIIQGISLAALGIGIHDSFNNLSGTDNSEEMFRIITHALMSFSYIIVVTYSYVWFIIIYRREPRIPDILLPFMVGLSEMLMAFFISLSWQWYFLTSAF